MRTLAAPVLAVVVATAVAFGPPTGSVDAQVSSVANGRRCGLGSITDPTVTGSDTQTGQVNAGPIVAAAPGSTVTITCTVQVGAANSAHSGTDAVSVTSAPSVQSASFAPTLVSYVMPEGQPVHLCTHIVVNGHSWYWDTTQDANGAAVGWSTSSSAGCAEAVVQEFFPGPFAPVLDIAYAVITDVVDPFMCGQLAGLAPGVPGVLDIDWTGDTHLLGEFVWDCPPYEFYAAQDEHYPSMWLVCAGSSTFTLCV